MRLVHGWIIPASRPSACSLFIDTYRRKGPGAFIVSSSQVWLGQLWPEFVSSGWLYLLPGEVFLICMATFAYMTTLFICIKIRSCAAEAVAV